MKKYPTRKIIIILLVTWNLSACTNASLNNDTTPFKLAAKKIFPPIKNKLKHTPSLSTYKKTKALRPSSKITGIQAIQLANRKSLQKPNSFDYIHSTMAYHFFSGALYEIYCAPLNITDLQFKEDEQITSISAGDTTRWQISKTFSGTTPHHHEHLLIKPSAEELQTEVVITTTKRTYHLILHSTKDTSIASVMWNYADEEENPTQPVNKIKNKSNQNMNIHKLDFAYSTTLLKGEPPKWFPIVVFNDGEKTYIQFPKQTQDLPVLLIADQSKMNNIVNYHIKGNYYIVDNLFKHAQLRSDQDPLTLIQIDQHDH